jgi:hypothetical protein
MRFALDPGDAVTHGEEQAAAAQVTGEQPESVVASVQHDATFRQLGRQMRARNDRDRPAVDGLLDCSDGCPVERREFAFREESVPGGEPDQVIASATSGKQRPPLGPVNLGAGAAGVRPPDTL